MNLQKCKICCLLINARGTFLSCKSKKQENDKEKDHVDLFFVIRFNSITTNTTAFPDQEPVSTSAPYPKVLELSAPTLLVTASDFSPMNICSPSLPTATLTPAMLQVGPGATSKATEALYYSDKC